MTGSRPPTLRREIVLWYSVVLLIAQSVLSGLTFLLLRWSLESSVRTSLQQSAQTIERMNVPPEIPRLGTTEEIVQLPGEGVELLRRRTLLATGQTDYAAMRHWVSAPSVAVVLVLFIGTALYHSMLGVQVVIEDYVGSEGRKLAALLLSKFAHALVAAAGIFAVLKVALA